MKKFLPLHYWLKYLKPSKYFSLLGNIILLLSLGKLILKQLGSLYLILFSLRKIPFSLMKLLPKATWLGPPNPFFLEQLGEYPMFSSLLWVTWLGLALNSLLPKEVIPCG
jgi:hypothetical protein